MKKPRFAILFGANLNMLGQRVVKHYGTATLAEVEAELVGRAKELNVEIDVVQSNFEGELINWVHSHRREIDGYIVNPGGFTMHGQGFRDAIVDTNAPLIEVHWSNIHARGIKSLWSEAAVGQISGLQWRGALFALDALSAMVQAEDRLRPMPTSEDEG